MGFLVSVVVSDHDVAGFASVEVEDDAELVVDADAVLALEFSLEFLQVVAGLDRSPSSFA
jgi:hypothetical protein